MFGLAMLILIPWLTRMSTRIGSGFLTVRVGVGNGAAGVGTYMRANDITFGCRESCEATGRARRRGVPAGGCGALRPLASRGQMSVRPAMGVVG